MPLPEDASSRSSDPRRQTGPGSDPGLFPPTQWSLIRQVQASEETVRQAGMERLCACYWKPVYVWLRAKGTSREDAQDVAQDFFSRLIAGDWLAEVSEEKGRLRAFLLVLLKRHAANAWEYRQAKKRGGGVVTSLNALEGEAAWKSLPADGLSPDVVFDRHWALQLLDQVMQSLRTTYANARKAEVFEELRDYLSGGGADDSYAASAARLGMTTGAVKVAAYRLRERYRERLRATVMETVASPEEVEAELDWLFRVFH